MIILTMLGGANVEGDEKERENSIRRVLNGGDNTLRCSDNGPSALSYDLRVSRSISPCTTSHSIPTRKYNNRPPYSEYLELRLGNVHRIIRINSTHQLSCM